MLTIDHTLRNFHSQKHVAGLTHGFYRYPATTSPELIRELIIQFTNQHDIIMDPFMGGGTAIVEALAHGRRAIGIDLNPLALFVTRVKTTPVSSSDWQIIDDWLALKPLRLVSDSMRRDPRTHNLSYDVKALIARSINALSLLASSRQRSIVRCALLKTAQWAIETREIVPDIELFELKLEQNLRTMRMGLDTFLNTAKNFGIAKSNIIQRRILIKGSVDRINSGRILGAGFGNVKLVLTSPPYPGVHVLYHRWQIRGRRETAAPFWITRLRDGAGPSFYTMGGRSEKGEQEYFFRLRSAFEAIRPLLLPDAAIVQIVAFHDPLRQRPLFEHAMTEAGYREIELLPNGGEAPVRAVPNRRWYARGKDFTASKEYLFIYRPST